MPQGVDSTTLAASQGKFFRWVYLADFEFDSGTVRVHNGIGTLTHNGNDYLGVGEFGRVDPIKESGQVQPYSVTFTLSGVDDIYKNNSIDFYQTVKGEDIFNRRVVLYVAALDTDNQIMGTPLERFVGFMERPTVNRGATNVVQIRAENELALFDRVNGSRYTDSNLQNEYAGDLGFEYLSRVIDSKVIWRGRNSNIGGRGSAQTKTIDLGNSLIR